MDIERWFKFIEDNKWHYVVIIDDKFYIDGKLIGEDDKDERRR